MENSKRALARTIARQYLEKDDPVGWFEALYSAADGNSNAIPWADMAPNPNLMNWVDRHMISGRGRKALVVGCGLGDDAEELSNRKFDVIAFDISMTAIRWCRKRFPNSKVTYAVKDLFDPPSTWLRAFDLVVECYTLQVLPLEMRRMAIGKTAGFVGSGGIILVLSRGRDPGENRGNMPWPLTKSELSIFKEHGLKEISFEDFFDHEDPPVRRFRVVYGRQKFDSFL